MERRVSVSQACKLVGKSESTIKRMVREIARDPAHPDRGLISPSHEEVEARRAVRKPYAWRISEELLLRRFPPPQTDGPPTPPPASGPPDAQLIVSVLQEQLQSKDEQIRTLEGQLDRKTRVPFSSNLVIDKAPGTA